ncbi:hypothetical protein MU0083_001751 [[Mycobacterium] kokjensenii]|uniref:Methyltransferase domain-containing protein n=1 Tax=[Mycobacterium] kokjensenii TaxID=3064287 RepID=A0ABN9N079_9MYCO|nr:hypothetical protein [Mycolicibacter sp. MU0083]CAJ1497737.1 hypothetical protein MU0083_001751 [Mycolicibacter sp. MU0083]
MVAPPYRVKFSPDNPEFSTEDSVEFGFATDDDVQILQFDDYSEIHKIPGRCEEPFYSRLRCHSPGEVMDLLERALQTDRESPTELRILDLGAGNGIMGETLTRHGVARLVGVDLGRIGGRLHDALKERDFDCLTWVAAPGSGDIPVRAFSMRSGSSSRAVGSRATSSIHFWISTTGPGSPVWCRPSFFRNTSMSITSNYTGISSQ